MLTPKENWAPILYMKGMAALVLNRFEEPTAAKMIIESLKETASTNEIGVCIGLLTKQVGIGTKHL
jgi:hypothetical protein